MLTYEQALTEHEFHYGKCKKIVGPRGGVTRKQEIYRRNGKTQTWRTRPHDFRIPVKFGLYGYSEITQRDVHEFHAASACPLIEE